MQGFDEVSLKIFKEAMPSLPNAPLLLTALSSQVIVNLCGCDQEGRGFQPSSSIFEIVWFDGVNLLNLHNYEH